MYFVGKGLIRDLRRKLRTSWRICVLCVFLICIAIKGYFMRKYEFAQRLRLERADDESLSLQSNPDKVRQNESYLPSEILTQRVSASQVLYSVSDKQESVFKPETRATTSESLKHFLRILSWTKRFAIRKAWWPEGTSAFDICELPGGLTCDYTSKKEDYATSDAVLFKLRRIKGDTILPSYRLPHQKWILFETEPPTKSWSYVPSLDPNTVRYLFNLTSTYASDSSIPARIINCKQNQEIYKQLEGFNFSAGKSKNVAWFVSHCTTPSKREDYVKELQKYIDVDVYGACGTMECDRYKGNRKLSDLEECDKAVLNATYKFYLSFENSLCEEYVTEKLTRIVFGQITTIPVVMGYFNYSSILPRGSYIDVRDYASPAHLADHLKEIAGDDGLFNEYIRRKNSVQCSLPQKDYYACRLCQYLHDNRLKQQITPDVFDYWSVDNKCITDASFKT